MSPDLRSRLFCVRRRELRGTIQRRSCSMCRIVDLSLLSNWYRLLALCTFIVSLTGCAMTSSVQEKAWLSPSHVEKDIERNQFSVERGDDIIGRLAVIMLEK